MATNTKNYLGSRALALVAASVILAPALIGCGSVNGPEAQGGGYGNQTAPMGGQPQKKGMSTKTKLVLLAGAAGLYYMYKKNKEKRAQMAQGGGNTGSYPAGIPNQQLYLSKNGRVYYRDPNNPRNVIWVSPPQGGFQVPESEAQEYQQFRGYNGQNTGRDLVGLGFD